jgi:hypothetical protein
MALGIGLTGCFNGQQPGAPTVTPVTNSAGIIPPSQIMETSRTQAPTEPDELAFNNCGSSVALTARHSVSRDLTFVTSWEFGDQVGVGGEVSVTPLAKVNVDASVTAKYGHSVNQSMSYSDQFDINVPARSRMTYVYNWKEDQRIGYLLAAGQKIDYKFPAQLTFAGASAAQDACDPPATTLAAPPPTPAPTALAYTAPVRTHPAVGIVVRPVANAAPSPLPTPTALEAFVKNWTNTDPNSSGLTRISISQNGGSGLAVHVFGKCTPTDCDWGSVQAPYDGKGAFTVPYKFSFKITTLSLQPHAGQLSVNQVDHYTGTPSTPDRTASYEFH